MSNTNVLNEQQIVSANKVLSQTYTLLGMNLLTSALCAFGGYYAGIAMVSIWVMLPVYFLLLFAVNKTANSGLGLFFVFLLTGWLGFTLGPVLRMYTQMEGGTEIIMQALAGTGILFVVLSAWVHVNKTKMTSWGGFLSIGMLSAFILGLLNYFLFQSSMLSLVLSCVFMFISGAIIMYQTSEIIHGGETNYIRATVTLFVSLYNMFLSLLNILSNR